MMFKVIVIFLLMMVILGATSYEGGVSRENLDNVTKKLDFDNINISVEKTLRDSIDDSDSKATSFVKILMGKYADVFLFAGLEGGKTAINYGYENPNFNFRLLLIMIFIACILAIVKPLIYILIFAGYGAMALYKRFKKPLKDFKNNPKTKKSSKAQE